MKVGIDVRALEGTSGRRGVGSYIRGLLVGLAELRGEEEIVLFARDGASAASDGFEHVKLARPRRAITFWDQLAWPALLMRLRVDVFHSPFYAVPRVRPRRCAVVQTVHDLTPLKLPGAFSARNARLFKLNFSLARTADRIIVPSRATRDDVVGLLSVPESRIAVIPQAAGISAAEIAEAEDRVEPVRSRLGLAKQRPYLLHTGGHDVVKNLPRLLEAFAELRREGRAIDLVIAGEHGPATGVLIGQATALGVLDAVRLPGYVPRAEMIALYRGAAALVYPSYAEGFGLPVLEAMACGTPVVASDASSIPEVAGGACALIPPADAPALAAAIRTILDDPATADRMRREGMARAAGYTWRETARRTLQVYREAAS